MGSAITSWGSALPDKVLTNSDFEARLDTSDAWIVERTGIHERRIGSSNTELAIDAGKAILGRIGLSGEEVDLLIVATTTPDRTIPATSSAVHEALRVRGGAFDVNAACAGFVYGLVTANAMLRIGHSKVLVIGSELLSRVTDFEDRSTAVLFGDGAAGVLLEATDGEDLIVSYDLGVDGSAESLLYAELGGYIQMDGKEVFRRAVRAELHSITKVLEQANLAASDIALFVPHQANVRIIEAVNERIGFDLEHTALVLDKTGNTSAASIPLALCDAIDHDRLHEGDLVLLSGFGAGMTWASAIVRWGAPSSRESSMSNRVVLVTGGSRGIGLACARRFQSGGDKVAITYKNAPPADLEGESGDALFALRCDVTVPEDVEGAFVAIEEKLGPVEVLICSAGINEDALLLRMDEERWARVLDTNLTANFRIARRAISPMIRARTGRIVFVSSAVAFAGNAGQTNYAASKAGLIGFARSLAREVASRAITVNVVAPGFIATDMVASVDEKRMEAFRSQIPLGRLGEADEVAGAVEYLASPGAGYLTGSVLVIDGGLSMGH